MSVTTYFSLAGQLIGEHTAGGPQIDYIPDALGSIVAAVDENLNTVYTASYTPFGQTLASTGTTPRVTWCGTLGYLSSAGQTHCEYRVSTRFYSDTAGSWTSVDKLWPSQPAYGYAGANPTTRTDPSGMAGTGVGTGGASTTPQVIADFIKVYTSRAGQGPSFTQIAGAVAVPKQIDLMADPNSWTLFYLGAADALEGGISVAGTSSGACDWRAFLNRATKSTKKKDEADAALTGVTCGSVVPMSLAFHRAVLAKLGGLVLASELSKLWVKQAPHPLFRRPVPPMRAKMTFSAYWPFGAGSVPSSHSTAQWRDKSMMLFLPGSPAPRPWNRATAPYTTPPIQGREWYRPSPSGFYWAAGSDYTLANALPLGASLRAGGSDCACTAKSSQGTGTGIPT